MTLVHFNASEDSELNVAFMIVEKGDNDGDKHFLIFPVILAKFNFPSSLWPFKQGIVW